MEQLIVINEKGKLMELSFMAGHIKGKAYGYIEIGGLRGSTQHNGTEEIVFTKATAK